MSNDFLTTTVSRLAISWQRQRNASLVFFTSVVWMTRGSESYVVRATKLFFA